MLEIILDRRRKLSTPYIILLNVMWCFSKQTYPLPRPLFILTFQIFITQARLCRQWNYILNVFSNAILFPIHIPFLHLSLVTLRRHIRFSSPDKPGSSFSYSVGPYMCAFIGRIINFIGNYEWIADREREGCNTCNPLGAMITSLEMRTSKDYDDAVN